MWYLFKTFLHLCINHNIIKKDGFSALQKALLFSERSTKLLQCHKEKCSGSCSRQRIYNNQIFIELDIRENINAVTGIKCELKDFPIKLNLNTDEYRFKNYFIFLIIKLFTYFENMSFVIYISFQIGRSCCPTYGTLRFLLQEN